MLLLYAHLKPSYEPAREERNSDAATATISTPLPEEMNTNVTICMPLKQERMGKK